MSDFFKVIFLAVLQGVTEFLPISSSGHLAIADKLIGLNSPGIRIEVMLHFATFLAVLVYYRKTLLQLLMGIIAKDSTSWKKIGLLFIGCIPAIFAYVFLGDWLETQYDDSATFPACMLIVTGVFLLSLKFVKFKDSKPITLWRAILIGMAQSIALLPGISRSGSTITCARYLGVDGKEAADFSFLMALPLLFGGTLLHLISGEPPEPNQVGWGTLIPAMIVAAVVGYISISLLLKTLTGRKFWMFGIYCILAGTLTLIFV